MVFKLNFEIALSLLATLYPKFADTRKSIRYVGQSSVIHTHIEKWVTACLSYAQVCVKRGVGNFREGGLKHLYNLNNRS